MQVELFAPDKEQARTHAVPLAAEERGGYFSGIVAEARTGSLYKYRLEQGSFPDPVSRFQPQGPHGPSQVVDPGTFKWTDSHWKGRPEAEWVIYELHLGTFTPEGTWNAAAAHLRNLQELGVTVVEVMPVAEFPGNFGWGYDGVDIFAPYHLYGSPDEARAFVDQAHALGLMVILDVVYNHLGPDGNFLRPYSKDYFSEKYQCEWGQALNFDGENSAGPREFFLSNVRHWISEYHFDGLRLDATQQIFDSSPVHILAEISRAARAAAPGRILCLVGEDESQRSRLVHAYEDGGYGLDAIWNDDFHHSARVAATGRVEAYYTDYRGVPQEFVSALKYGFLYQGQWYLWQQKRRGHAALNLRGSNFVTFLQNHDQVANSLRGERLHQLTSPACLRALTALSLLGPSIPMLFQGQEFGASAPFLYFADHHQELGKLVREGRHRSLWQFRSIATTESRDLLTEPTDRVAFTRCKLDHAERTRNTALLRFHQDLLTLRRDYRALTQPENIDGAVLGAHAFVIRYFSDDGDDLLLLVNLGADLFLSPAPEPLLAPVELGGWSVLWSSESPEYGGAGTPAPDTRAGWILPGFATLLLKSNDNPELDRPRLSEKD